MHQDTDNMARHALDAGIAAATLTDPLIPLEEGRLHLLVPDGFTVKDVTDPLRLPSRIKQKVIVDTRASLVSYANRFQDHRSVIIADYDAGTISAHLDFHGDNEHELAAQHNAHTATLKLRDSEEYARWNEMEGGMHSQEEFAMFIEENVADVSDPDHSDLIEICRELEASQGVRFKSGTRLDNGDRAFTYETETHVKSEISVPQEIRLQIPLYFGEEPTEIRAKFRFRPTTTGLVLGFIWHRVEYMRQAKFQEMATLAADETGLPVFFGRQTT